MKTVKLFLFILILLFSVSIFSQTKSLTIDDAVVGVYRELAPESLRAAAFRPESKEVTYLKNDVIISRAFDSSIETELFSLEGLNNILNNSDIQEYKYFPSYKWLSNNTIRINRRNSIIEIDIKNNKLIRHIDVDDKAENVEFHEKSSYLAYTIENNLYVQGNSSKAVAITNESNKDIVYGQTVHRNEFGIDKGIFWSPNGLYLAFYRKDETMVTDYPLVNTNARIAELDNIKYCMAGMKSEEVTVGIYDIKNGKTIYLKTGEPKEQYLTNVSWSPDEKSIYIAVLNREQNHMKFNQYDALTGDFVKTLFEEKNDKYVEPSHAAIFLPKDNSKFIWQTRKDGYSHLYLYDISGKEIFQITKGNFEVQTVYGFTSDKKNIIIRANKETPIDFNIYSVNIEKGTMTIISKEQGSHNAIISDDGEYVMDYYSSITVPSEYIVYDSKGKKISTYLTSKNPLEEYKLGELKIGTLKANDSKTDLYYRMILPVNFDKTKKYPCIVYVYGGPHAQMVANRWMGGAAGWDYFMAQEGYIVFTLDNRGSANRGLEFENIIHRQLGIVECRDQLTGIEYLRSLGYVDMDRIGVHGWSYGGFMTTTLMTDFYDIFKVGVAGGPVINWELYEIMYGERYMDTPQENPEGYKNSNLLNKVDKLSGRLMIIHGAMDPVVVWQHSLNFLNKCIEKKVLVDYFVYPSHEHNVRGLDRVHLMRTVTRYFKDNL